MIDLRKTFALLTIMCAFVGFSYLATARQDAHDTAPSNVSTHGYDVTAYFNQGRPVKGKQGIVANYDRTAYRFATIEGRMSFVSDPPAFMPAYSGYCAYGVRMGKKLPIDPHAWSIVDGKLYLFLDKATQQKWEEDIADNINIANRVWPGLKDQPES